MYMISCNRCDKGIFLPLIAAIFVGVLAVIIFLAVYPPITKSVSATLREKVEVLCQSAIDQAPLGADMLSTFKVGVDAVGDDFNNLSYAKLVSANISFPLMFFGSNFEGEIRGTSCSESYVNIPTGLQLPYISFAALGIGRCNLDGNRDCNYIDDPCLLENVSSSDVRIPQQVLWKTQSAGNAVYCELEAEVDPGFFSGIFMQNPKKVRAKTLVWVPLLNVNEREIINSTFQTRHGLTLIVAPEVSINRSEASSPVRFSLNNNSSSFYTFPQEYNALFNSNSFFRVNSPAFNYSPYSFSSYNFTQLDQLPRSGSFSLNVASGSLMCQSSLTMVRNVFLYTILELAARNGHLRSFTRVLLAQPQHRAYTSSMSAGELPNILNNPILWFNFGEDLVADSSKTLPYISYFGGISGGLPAEFGYGLSSGSSDILHGMVQPFYQGSSPVYGMTDQLAKLHGVLASQLAYCYHFYTANLGIPDDYPKADLPLAMFHQRNSLPSFVLEQSEYNIVDKFLRYVARPSWQANGSSELASIRELILTLGSIDQCPIYDLPSSYQGCLDASNSFYDLKGDIISSLLAVSNKEDLLYPRKFKYKGQELNSAMLVSNTYPALANNGLYELKGSSLTEKENNLSASLTSSGPNPQLFPIRAYTALNGSIVDNSLIFIIFHQPFSAEEAVHIRDIVSRLNRASGDKLSRPVIAVYLPAYKEDTNLTNMEAIYNALGIDPLAPEDSLNKLFVISPYVRDSVSGSFIFPDFASMPEQDSFNNFWRLLLAPQDYLDRQTYSLKNNIVTLAINIYKRIAGNVSRKF